MVSRIASSILLLSACSDPSNFNEDVHMEDMTFDSGDLIGTNDPEAESCVHSRELVQNTSALITYDLAMALRDDQLNLWAYSSGLDGYEFIIEDSEGFYQYVPFDQNSNELNLVLPVGGWTLFGRMDNCRAEVPFVACTELNDLDTCGDFEWSLDSTVFH